MNSGPVTAVIAVSAGLAGWHFVCARMTTRYFASKPTPVDEAYVRDQRMRLEVLIGLGLCVGIPVVPFYGLSWPDGVILLSFSWVPVLLVDEVRKHH